MKRNRQHYLTAAIATLALGLAGSAPAASLSDFKTVYVLPMSNGLDQYLASQLTIGSVLQVVTDPRKADVIFTDHVGESLEATLTDLYAEKPKSSDAAEDKPDDSARTFGRSGMQGQRGRGTVFLVDRKSRAVVWSDFESANYPSPDGMRKTAGHIAGKLARAIKGK